MFTNDKKICKGDIGAMIDSLEGQAMDLITVTTTRDKIKDYKISALRVLSAITQREKELENDLEEGLRSLNRQVAELRQQQKAVSIGNVDVLNIL